MTTTATVPTQSLQGIEVPATAIDPRAFFQATRRLTIPQKTLAYAGLGSTDTISVLQTGIISALSIKFSGTLTVTPGTGTVATTARWPYDLIRACRFSANGQSNLINVPGSFLKLRDIEARGDLTDRSVSQGFGGASPGTTRTNGTLSLNGESWGVASNVTAIGAGSYSVELNWAVPIAFDQVNLLGAIFAQTASTDLVLGIDWAPSSDLFVLTGNATATLTGTVVVESTLYSIPQGPNGIVVPDLSSFHSYIATRYPAIANGVNEVRLTGQGVGRSLLRVNARVLNGAAPGTPLVVSASNYGQLGWRYGGNDTPEVWTDGQHLRYVNERTFNSDIGALFGFWCLDFSSENAFRDSIDEGTASELRLLCEIPNAVTLTTPVLEYAQETVFAGATGA